MDGRPEIGGLIGGRFQSLKRRLIAKRCKPISCRISQGGKRDRPLRSVVIHDGHGLQHARLAIDHDGLPAGGKLQHEVRAVLAPGHHRDPFDRILVAQAQLEDVAIITADPQIAAYEVQLVRA